MTDSILMQYLGFTPERDWREYWFRVRYTADDIREFTLTILNEAFTTHKVQYQDGPDVCSMKLRRELVADPHCPSHTNFAISNGELDAYKAGRGAKPSGRFRGPKPRDDY
jgi:hypothetical protein